MVESYPGKSLWPQEVQVLGQSMHVVEVAEVLGKRPNPVGSFSLEIVTTTGVRLTLNQEDLSLDDFYPPGVDQERPTGEEFVEASKKQLVAFGGIGPGMWLVIKIQTLKIEVIKAIEILPPVPKDGE